MKDNATTVKVKNGVAMDANEKARRRGERRREIGAFK